MGLSDNIKKLKAAAEVVHDTGLHNAIADAGHSLTGLGRNIAEAGHGLEMVATGLDKTKVVVVTAAEEAKLLDKHGDLSKWRLARAAIRPTTTAERLMAGAVKGISDVAHSGQSNEVSSVLSLATPKHEISRRRPQLSRKSENSRYPPTDYGYQPPDEAEVGGWRCAAETCGKESHVADVSQWPKVCPSCGSQVLSAFLREPWDHFELRTKIDTVLSEGPAAIGYSYWHDQDAAWHYKQALINRDFSHANAIRLIVEDEIGEDREQFPEHTTGSRRITIVSDALAYGALNQACDELLRWHRDAITTCAEVDSGQRADCRQLMDASIAFLAQAGAASVAEFEAVYEAAADLFNKIEPVATADNVQGWAGIRRR